MFSWLLEDAAYDFYVSNCKGCDKRVPVGLPNIIEFVGPREQADEQRKLQRQSELEKRQREQAARREERTALRNDLSLEETLLST